MMSKENKKPLLDKTWIIGLILIAVVVSTPFVYAIVEPHIKITMDVAQTTKPFQIVDDQDTEVFSVDVDGTISPSPPQSPITMTAGIEETVLDHSDYIGISNFHPIDVGLPSAGIFATQFALPTTADWWKISAFEVHTGTGQVQFANSADFNAYKSLRDELPIVTLIGLDIALLTETVAHGDIFDDHASPLAESTIFKGNVYSNDFVAGGTDLVVEVRMSQNFGGIEGRLAISGDVFNQVTGGGTCSSFCYFTDDFLDTTHEFYLVVYATPYS